MVEPHVIWSWYPRFMCWGALSLAAAQDSDLTAEGTGTGWSLTRPEAQPWLGTDWQVDAGTACAKCQAL